MTKAQTRRYFILLGLAIPLSIMIGAIQAYIFDSALVFWVSIMLFSVIGLRWVFGGKK